MENNKVDIQKLKMTAFFEKFEGLKEWIEQTQLFQLLVENSGNTNCTIEAFTEEEVLILNLNHKKITIAEELPIEIVAKFFRNSPFYRIEDKQGNNKQIDNYADTVFTSTQ